MSFMRAKGIGSDLIEVSRIKKAIQTHGSFLDKVFTKKEQDYCSQFKDPYVRYAGKFAAKEAISKALGIGICSKLNWLDMEILNDENGKPTCSFSVKGKKILKRSKIFLSISHEKHYAFAVALCV